MTDATVKGSSDRSDIAVTEINTVAPRSYNIQEIIAAAKRLGPTKAHEMTRSEHRLETKEACRETKDLAGYLVSQAKDDATSRAFGKANSQLRTLDIEMFLTEGDDQSLEKSYRQLAVDFQEVFVDSYRVLQTRGEVSEASVWLEPLHDMWSKDQSTQPTPGS